jgi:hypothetical protein
VHGVCAIDAVMEPVRVGIALPPVVAGAHGDMAIWRNVSHADDCTQRLQDLLGLSS